MTISVYTSNFLRLKFYARIKQSPLPGEVLRFGIVGIAATIVHASIGFIMAVKVGMPINLANTFGFLAAWSISYTGHSRLSFKNHGQGRKAFYRFIIHSVVLFLIATYIANLTQKNLQITESLVPVIAAITIPILSLVSTKLFVFRKFKI